MIPTLIYLFLRRYKTNNPEKSRQIANTIGKIFRLLILLLLLLLMSTLSFSQIDTLRYDVKRKGTKIGTISLIKNVEGAKCILTMKSTIRTRVLFLFTAIGEEETIYENGIMVRSKIYQQLNGDDRVNKKTTLIGKSYVTIKGNRQDTVGSYPISYNMISLYAKEPVAQRKVYSDKFQQLLDIEILGKHHYKVRFPDGGYNEYFYKEGVCVKVEVHHRLFRSSFELKK